MQHLLILLSLISASAMRVQDTKGIISAQPGYNRLPEHQRQSRLYGFTQVRVEVEGVPSAFASAVGSGEVYDWVANRLRNMGIHVVTQEEQRRIRDAADVSTDAKLLQAFDRGFSSVSLTFIAVKRGDTHSVYFGMSCTRGAFLEPGLRQSATVWRSNYLAAFHESTDAKGLFRERINALLDNLERDWRRGNGR